MVAAELPGATLIAFIVASTAISLVMLADVFKLRIPNALWMSFTLSGLLFHALAPLGCGLEFGLVGAFLGFGLSFMPFLAGGIATRDLKLTAGVGAWFGPSLTISGFACVAAVAGLYHVLAFFRRSNVEDRPAGLRIMYYRLRSLLRYLAADDGAPGGQENVELDEKLVFSTTAIVMSTMLLLGFIVVFWI